MVVPTVAGGPLDAAGVGEGLRSAPARGTAAAGRSGGYGILISLCFGYCKNDVRNELVLCV